MTVALAWLLRKSVAVIVSIPPCVEPEYAPPGAEPPGVPLTDQEIAPAPPLAVQVELPPMETLEGEQLTERFGLIVMSVLATCGELAESVTFTVTAPGPVAAEYVLESPVGLFIDP